MRRPDGLGSQAKISTDSNTGRDIGMNNCKSKMVWAKAGSQAGQCHGNNAGTPARQARSISIQMSIVNRQGHRHNNGRRQVNKHGISIMKEAQTRHSEVGEKLQLAGAQTG